MTQSSTTKAADWAEARQRGVRLPEHELIACDLCPDSMTPDPAVFDATGLNICPQCLEDSLASTVEPRTEVGLA